LTIISISGMITGMSKSLEQLADKGDTVIDAAVARFSEKHLPQSPEARAKRQHAARVGGNILIGLTLAGGVAGVTELAYQATDHQAQHVQEESTELSQKTQTMNNELDSGVITLPAPSQDRP